MLRGLVRTVGWALVGGWTAVCALGLAPRTWGLVLAVLATAATLLALPRGTRRLGFCLGWAGVVALVLPARPEGDLVVVADAHGWTLLVTAVLVAVAGVATLPGPARSRRTPPSAT